MRHDYKLKDIDQHLRVLIYHDEDEGVWLAHCLEMDHVESADTKEAAILALLRVIASELKECEVDDVNPFVLAPRTFWQRYWTARPFSLSRKLIERHGIPTRRIEIKEIPCECH